jgi:hypothetical protein
MSNIEGAAAPSPNPAAPANEGTAPVPSSQNSAPANPEPATPATPDASAAPKEPAKPATESTAESQSERVVPEKYDLKLTQDSILDSAALDRVASYAKAQQLTQEEAVGMLQAQEEDARAFINERKTTWVSEAKADKEIGGDKFTEHVELSKRALEAYGTPKLRAELDRSGFGNYPEIIRVFARIGKEIANDSSINPSQNTAVDRKPTSEIFYPKQEGA